MTTPVDVMPLINGVVAKGTVTKGDCPIRIAMRVRPASATSPSLRRRPFDRITRGIPEAYNISILVWSSRPLRSINGCRADAAHLDHLHRPLVRLKILNEFTVLEI